MGLGTATPTAIGAGYRVLDIRGSAGGTVRFGIAAGVNGAVYADANGVQLDALTSGLPIFFLTASLSRMRIYNDGGVSIGEPASGSKGAGTLNVASAIFENGFQLISGTTLALTGARLTQGYWTNITSTNAVTVDSSLESKVRSTMRDYTGDALAILSRARVKVFQHLHYLDPSDRYKLGVVAEDFAAEPLLLQPIAKPRGGSYPGINMMALLALHTKAIQELQQRVEAGLR